MTGIAQPKNIKTKKARHWLEQLTLPVADRWELDQTLARWQLLETQRQACEVRLQAALLVEPQAQLLTTLPGCGAYTALTLSSRIGELKNFPTARSLVNYWGLAPTSKNSGQVTQRLGSISKQGSPLARALIGQLVRHALQKSPALRTWHQAVKQRRGGKIALVAVMRKLVVCLWNMLRRQVPFSEAQLHIHQRPRRVRGVSPATQTSVLAT